MNYIKKFPAIGTLVLFVALIASLIHLADAQPTPAQFVASPSGNFLSTPTNLWSTYSSSLNVIPTLGYTNYTTNAAAFLLRPGFGFALSAYITNAAADAGKVVTFSLQRSVDGVNWDAGTNYQLSATLLGQTNTYTTNFPDSLVTGYYAVRPMTTTNAGASSIGVALTFARPIPWNPSPRGY